MGGLAHHTRQDEVERNYSSLVGHGPLETYLAYILYYTLSVPMSQQLTQRFQGSRGSKENQRVKKIQEKKVL
jgi:hypothetical protein